MIRNLGAVLDYYEGTVVQVIGDHLHFGAVGKVIGGNMIRNRNAILIKREDTSETFYVFTLTHLKIIIHPRKDITKKQK